MLVKTSRKLTLAYLSLLLVTLSTEIELNPGPFACGSYGTEVLDEDAVSCDNCNLWYHIQYQDILFGTYENHQADEVSFAWICLNCEAQNYSTKSTNSNPSLASFLSENSFSALEFEMTSSSFNQSGISSPLTITTQNDRKRTASKKFPKLKVLNINFQSVRNKIPDLHALVAVEQPDIIISTESWLTPNIQNSEIIPPNLGNSIFKEDRTVSFWGCGIDHGQKRHHSVRAERI